MNKKDVKIMLVDDEPDILEILKYNLKNEGYQVQTASDGLEALHLALTFEPHLIILDVMMPLMDGIETCQQLRKFPSLNGTLIMFLSARGEDFSQMAGFGAGADDYITKPIKPSLLVIKVNAVLRRLGKIDDLKKVYKVRDLLIYTREYKVRKGSEDFYLPKKEFELLMLLASKPGTVFSRDEIMEQVWNGVVVSGRSIDVHIRKLREKLGEDKFQTVKGVGYKILP